MLLLYHLGLNISSLFFFGLPSYLVFRLLMCEHIVDPGVMQRQSTVDSEQLERSLVLLREVVPVEPVHHLDHAYHPILAHNRHTQDTLRRVAGLFVDVTVKTRVFIRVADIQNLEQFKR